MVSLTLIDLAAIKAGHQSAKAQAKKLWSKSEDMDSENVDGVAHDLVSLLTREDRDFLVRNNGHQVFPIFSVFILP